MMSFGGHVNLMIMWNARFFYYLYILAQNVKNVKELWDILSEPL